MLGCHEIVKSGHVLGIRFGVVMAIFRVNCMGEELEGGLHRVWCGIRSATITDWWISNGMTRNAILCAYIEEIALLCGWHACKFSGGGRTMNSEKLGLESTLGFEGDMMR